jgi:hypothetical protein
MTLMMHRAPRPTLTAEFEHSSTLSRRNTLFQATPRKSATSTILVALSRMFIIPVARRSRGWICCLRVCQQERCVVRISLVELIHVAMQIHSDHLGTFIPVPESDRRFAEACPADGCDCSQTSTWHMEKDCETSVYTANARFVVAVMVWKCQQNKCQREWTGLGDFIHRHSRSVAISTEVCKCVSVCCVCVC